MGQLDTQYAANCRGRASVTLAISIPKRLVNFAQHTEVRAFGQLPLRVNTLWDNDGAALIDNVNCKPQVNTPICQVEMYIGTI